MDFRLFGFEKLPPKGDLWVVPLFEEDVKSKGNESAFARADKSLKGALSSAAQDEGFKGKQDQALTMHTLGKLPATRIIVLGLGSRAHFRGEALRLAAGRASKAARKLKAKGATVLLPSGVPAAEAVKAVVEGFALGAYRFDRYKSKSDGEKEVELRQVRIVLPDGIKPKDAAISQALRQGQSIAEATNWARDLVNEPAAVVTPTRLAEAAKEAAQAGGLDVTIGGRKEIAALKMGMFLGVAQGSVEEPRLIHLWYTPKDPAQAKRPPLALVGKAITFDSGGLSLKTAEGMVDMKTDMAGSAAVLAAMRVVGAMAPPFPVHAFIGACENMPSGNAYRPGDILISRLGRTVEITNTDAEGRLVLGDILTWANEHKPAALVDLATLTGACMVALGHYIVGAFGADDALVDEILAASKAAGEELWRLPIPESSKDALRSEVADMKNSGERYGGALNAAWFLQQFVGNTPWVHLDIAGPSQSPKERGYYSKGATGVGVRTLVEWVRQRSA